MIRQKISNIIISLAWLIFAYQHLNSFIKMQKMSLLLFFVSESLVFLLFIIRENPKSTSLNPWHWFCALTGTFLTLLYRPSLDIIEGELGKTLLIIGIIFQIASLFSLNRSLGIVPARRSIKTYGMYKIIRHPMYFSYIILFIGYLIDNTTLWNSIILGINILFLVLRIINEEKYLTSHIEYQEYMKKVRWKLIPYIY